MSQLTEYFKKIGHAAFHEENISFSEILSGQEEEELTKLLKKISDTLPDREPDGRHGHGGHHGHHGNADSEMSAAEMVAGGQEAIDAAASVEELSCNGCPRECSLAEPGCGRGRHALEMIGGKK